MLNYRWFTPTTIATIMSNSLKKLASVLLFFLTSLLLWLFFNYIHAYGGYHHQLIAFPISKHTQTLNDGFETDSNREYLSYQSESTSNYCQNKTKIMFSKNLKVAGTTISSILLQIASHYHKYEILSPKDFESVLQKKKANYGYLLSHKGLSSLEDFKKIFPKEEFLWISTTRKVADQVNSHIKFRQLEKFYKPSKFHKILKKVKSGKKAEGSSPFHNGGTSFILNECRHKEKEFEKFKSCALKVFKEFDLIIPVDRLNEGLIMLHKMTCLPLSDFAYTNKKISSSHFKVSAQNMSEILKFHERSIWFYNHSSIEFEKRFQKFQSEYCETINCRTEIEELKRENEKLEESCGLNRKEEGKFINFDYKWKKLKKNDTLALRCLSFALSGNSYSAFRLYNEDIKKNDDTTVGRIARDWLKYVKNEDMY